MLRKKLSEKYQTLKERIKKFLTFISETILPFAFIIGALFYYFFAGEQHGEVIYSDCREKVLLFSDTFEKYYKKFVCNKDGGCIHIDTNAQGQCVRASLYNKKQSSENIIMAKDIATDGREQFGVVKYSDCREKITLSSDTLKKYYTEFICNLDGLCAHVEIESSKCMRAFLYNKTIQSKELTVIMYKNDTVYKIPKSKVEEAKQGGLSLTRPSLPK